VPDAELPCRYSGALVHLAVEGDGRVALQFISPGRRGRRQAGTGDCVEATQRAQVLHQWVQRPSRDLRPQIAIKTVQPLFAQTHRLDTLLQHDLLRRMSKA
jgi:hypothetical protein